MPTTKSKRITSHELVEVRTVLSRAKTALDTMRGIAYSREAGHDYFLPAKHTSHELAMMRSALMTSIAVLGEVETKYGYRSAE